MQRAAKGPYEGGHHVGRDVSRLHVFREADRLVDDIYRTTTGMPGAERYGLRSQIRRASVSVPSNLGGSRRTTRDFLRFVELALGSASEAAYLLGVAARLSLLPIEPARDLAFRYTVVAKRLQKLIASLEHSP
jgi:four helix bundle protein